MELHKQPDPREDLPFHAATTTTTTTTTAAPASPAPPANALPQPQASPPPAPPAPKPKRRSPSKPPTKLPSSRAYHVDLKKAAPPSIPGSVVTKDELKKQRQRIHTARWRAKKRAAGQSDQPRLGGHQVGRPPLVPFTQELGARICELIRDGYTLLAIEELDGMPSAGTIAYWATKKDRDEIFSKEYAAARLAASHLRVDETIEAAKSAHDKDSAAAARAVLDAGKFSAAAWNREQFSERLAVDIRGKVDVEHTHTLAPAWLKGAIAGKVAGAISRSQKSADPQPVVLDNEPAAQQLPKPLTE